MKRVVVALLLSAAAIATANAKVHVVTKGVACSLGDDTIPGITPVKCKLLNDHKDGKIVQGCVVDGGYKPQLDADQCDLIDGKWMWVKP